MPDGSAFEFTQKANAVPTTVGGVTKDAKSSGEVAPTINTASENSISTSNGNVNAKFSMKGMDSAYLAAVERGDTEATQNAKTTAGEGSGNRSVVAIVTVEEHSSRVASIDYVDVTHFISGRLREPLI